MKIFRGSKQNVLPDLNLPAKKNFMAPIAGHHSFHLLHLSNKHNLKKCFDIIVRAL